jgi:hypothetical protein
MNLIVSLKNNGTTIHNLKYRYVMLLLPAAAGFVLIFVLRSFIAVELTVSQVPGAFSAAVFIVSVCTAVAMPVLYRTLFANRVRRQTHTSEADWLKFERSLLYIAMTTPYVGLMAQIMELQHFHLAGTMIMTLYAVYYYYPSKKRIDYERRMFRVQ